MRHGPLVCTPLRSEQAALRGAVSAPVVRTGMGPMRRIDAAGPVLVAGVAGALTDELLPGDLVVGDQLRTTDTAIVSHAAPLLFDAVRRLGLRVHLAPVLSITRVRDGRDRAALAATGAVAVDTESAFLAAQAPAGQTVALRAIVDAPSAPLLRPGIVRRGITGLRALRAAAPAIDLWAAAVGDREITMSAAGDLVARDMGDLDLRALAGVRRVGVVAEQPSLVDELIRCLSGLGRIVVADTIPTTISPEVT